MESKIAPPTYLYKILSYRNWQATENRKTVTLSAEDHDFIHLSTEEQLDKIIEKYWSDVPQFVVLKLSTNKLEGDLRLEANPGGTTKYYHLYQGFIPFSSITESKVIYRSPSEGSNKNILAIVEIGDPVLRKPAKELTKEEILSPEVQHLILEMKEAMRTAPGVGLAAPQIGQSLQIAVIEDLDHTQLTKEQLAERERYKVPYHVIINPRITIEESGMAEFFEGCLSIPDLVGIVSRAKSVRVECLNERAEPVVIQAKGWYARILQHEIDHLNGTLFVDHVKLPSLMTSENYVKFWKDKSIDKTLEELTFKRIEHGSKN
jgi:peptide deformylase